MLLFLLDLSTEIGDQLFLLGTDKLALVETLQQLLVVFLELFLLLSFDEELLIIPLNLLELLAEPLIFELRFVVGALLILQLLLVLHELLVEARIPGDGGGVEMGDGAIHAQLAGAVGAPRDRFLLLVLGGSPGEALLERVVGLTGREALLSLLDLAHQLFRARFPRVRALLVLREVAVLRSAGVAEAGGLFLDDLRGFFSLLLRALPGFKLLARSVLLVKLPVLVPVFVILFLFSFPLRVVLASLVANGPLLRLLRAPLLPALLPGALHIDLYQLTFELIQFFGQTVQVLLHLVGAWVLSIREPRVGEIYRVQRILGKVGDILLFLLESHLLKNVLLRTQLLLAE